MLCMFTCGFAQDVEMAKAVVETLSSPVFSGRGYVNQGCNMAADYIAYELGVFGVDTLCRDYKQHYTLTVNTFPTTAEASVGKRNLVPGEEFVVHPACRSTKKTFSLIWLPSGLSELDSVYLMVDTARLEGKMVVFPKSLGRYYMSGVKGIKNAVFLADKCFWHTSQQAVDMCYMMVRESALDRNARKLKVNFESVLETDYQVCNVAGIVHSSQPSDSMIVFTAHYDHLGMMGKAMFGGANDNASGTAVMLDLANHASTHRDELACDVAFVFVSGEEVGLCGSTYNSENPLFGLDKVSLLVNLDMVGSGRDGITLVNGKVYPRVVEKFNRLNKDLNLGIDIKLRGESCNSDHCPYYRLGVPSVFIYTQDAQNREYHTINDTADKLPFTIYDNFFKLMLGLINR